MSRRVEPFPGVFPGSIWTPPDVVALTGAADLVCRGRVARVVEEERTTYLVGAEEVEFRRRVATVHVDHAYKPAGTGGDVEVELLVPDAPSAVADLREGEDVVLFLQRHGSRYALADVTTGKIDAGSPAGRPGSPRDAIEQAIREAAGAPGGEVARELLDDLARR